MREFAVPEGHMAVLKTKRQECLKQAGIPLHFLRRFPR